jgi:hypothetical protein
MDGEPNFRVGPDGRLIFTDQEEQRKVVDAYEVLGLDGEDYTEWRKELGDEMYTFVRRIHDTPPDVMVFLDKSARPAYWFFDALWNEFYPGESHPKIKFINIGTEKAPNEAQEFLAITDPELFKANVRANEEQVKKVRKHFQIDQKSTETTQTYLDDLDHIMIIDEHASTGASLLTAEALFESAFGSRYFDNIEGVSLFSHEPPWLSKKEEFDSFALGVMDRKPGDYAVKPIIPHPPEVNQLKHEMQMLARETAQRYKEYSP